MWCCQDNISFDLNSYVYFMVAFKLALNNDSYSQHLVEPDCLKAMSGYQDRLKAAGNTEVD